MIDPRSRVQTVAAPNPTRVRIAHPSRLGAVLLTIAMLAGCAHDTAPRAEATAAASETRSNRDPLENVNRRIFAFNVAADHAVLRPIAAAYHDVTPAPVQRSVTNFFQNLGTPVVFGNDLLQGEFTRAGQSLARLAINTTVGLGGLFDPASHWSLPYHDADFGQTFGRWGIGDGPYLVLPILGPSTLRDAAGGAIGSYVDPANYVANDQGYGWTLFVRGGVSGINARAQYLDLIDNLEHSSLDYYATARSLYRQRRAAMIGDTTLPAIDDTPAEHP